MKNSDNIKNIKEIRTDCAGRRIRKIRKDMVPAMTQADLGTMIGLNADRIQQYENESRTPKSGLLLQFADALGVSAEALSTPDTTNRVGVMYALFEMEKLWNAELICTDNGAYSVSFADADKELKQYMAAWYDAKIEYNTAMCSATTDEDRKKLTNTYHMWEWNFPESASDKIRRAQLDLCKTQMHAKINSLKAQLFETANELEEVQKALKELYTEQNTMPKEE